VHTNGKVETIYMSYFNYQSDELRVRLYLKKLLKLNKNKLKNYITTIKEN